MKSVLLFITVAIAVSPTAVARDQEHNYERATITKMESVDCGVDEKGGESVAGELLGTDSTHKKTRKMLCPEYVLRSQRIVYRVRPKDDKHPVLLPVGEEAKFRIKKDVMLMRVPEGDDKEHAYTVVSMMPADSPKTNSEPKQSADKE
jgi:hypothetical protein